MSKKWWPILLILLLALVLRLAFLADIPPGLTHDEANHGREAMGILDGILLFYFPLNYGSEPLYSYTAAAFMRLLGEGIVALRLVNVVFGALAIWAAWLWSKRAFDKRIALTAAALTAVSFWPLASSREALRAGMLPFFMTAAVWFFWKIIAADFADFSRYKKGGVIVGFSVSITFTLHIYLAARVAWLLFPLFLVYLFLWHRSAFRRAWQPTLVGMGLGWLLAAPMFLYVRAHPYVLTRLDMLDGPLQALRSGQIAPVLQNASGALLAFVWPGYGDQFLAYNIPGRPVFEMVTAVFFIAGILISLFRWKRPSYAFVLLWFGVGIIPSLITGATANTTRNLAALPAVFLLPAIGFWGLGDWLTARFPRVKPTWLAGTAAVWLIIAGGVAARDYFLRWGQAAEVRDAYQHTLVEEVAWLRENGVTAVLMSSIYPGPAHDPSISKALWGANSPEERWTDARYALIFPHGQGVTAVIPAATPPHPAFTPFLQEQETIRLRPDDLTPFFTVYQVDSSGLADYLAGDTAVNFNDAVTLKHAQWLDTAVRPGETAQLLTVWQVTDPERAGPRVPPLFTTDLVMFTQILDENGRPLAQRDSLEAPSWAWQAGDVILQIHPVPIPPDTAPGSYPAIVGLYDRASGERLPVLNEHGDVVETYTAVPPLTIP
ncbi:MAG TPA: hypothetical protein ENK32_02270 [Anaerolineae bacterium]|nr:hypothetical protein [Anaerolineae bacterium]